MNKWLKGRCKWRVDEHRTDETHHTGSEMWASEARHLFSHCEVLCLHVCATFFYISYISPSVPLLDVCGWQVYSINRRAREKERDVGRACFVFPARNLWLHYRHGNDTKTMPSFSVEIQIHNNVFNKYGAGEYRNSQYGRWIELYLWGISSCMHSFCWVTSWGQNILVKTFRYF